eukprot:CAMPEP_0113697550 /NCGR_PEP_ID=MMETSP0038_2-20120614/22195_2 /TAXON_ID=2898 /ORGANISM="Cryptomonas paramecium" /LENGTH=80 /DNA_ID=CAMNT_0000620571 /DNA_START=308 /DNA_END=550 /DNA_ORIENTATION=- /assembly_acc=CAM_ASM_000170
MSQRDEGNEIGTEAETVNPIRSTIRNAIIIGEQKRCLDALARTQARNNRPNDTTQNARDTTMKPVKLIKIDVRSTSTDFR